MFICVCHLFSCEFFSSHSTNIEWERYSMPSKILSSRDTRVCNDLVGTTDIKQNFAQIIKCHKILEEKVKYAGMHRTGQG